MKYKLTRSRRFSVSLQITATGHLVVRAPYLYPTYLIDRFVESKKDWIFKRKLEQQKIVPRPKRFIADLELELLIKKLVGKYSQKMELSPSTIRFTKVKTYWGSCSPTGVVSFNLKLAFTNESVVEYVVVHELTHLRWRGHGPRFWSMVEKYYPQTKEVRTFLRTIPRSL